MIVAASLVCALGVGGCYLAHERGEGAAPTSPSWSDITTVFEPTDAPRPVLQGNAHALAASGEGFLVAWIFNHGQLGLATARFDREARLMAGGPTEVLPAAPPLDDSPDALDLLPVENGAVLYWLTRSRALRYRRLDAEGNAIGDLRELDVVGDERFTFLRVVRGEGRAFLSFGRDDQVVLVPLDARGDPAGEPFVLHPDAPVSSRVGDDGERAHLTWADRTPGERDDRLLHVVAAWDGSAPAEARVFHSARNAVVGAPFRIAAGMWAERSDLRSSVLVALDGSDRELSVSDSFASLSRVVLLPDGVAMVTGEADAPFTLPSRLFFRLLDPPDPAALETFVVTEGSRCRTIEGYQSAGNDDALAVSWIDHCGVRRLHVRVRAR